MRDDAEVLADPTCEWVVDGEECGADRTVFAVAEAGVYLDPSADPLDPPMLAPVAEAALLVCPEHLLGAISIDGISLVAAVADHPLRGRPPAVTR